MGNCLPRSNKVSPTLQNAKATPTGKSRGLFSFSKKSKVKIPSSAMLANPNFHVGRSVSSSPLPVHSNFMDEKFRSILKEILNAPTDRKTENLVVEELPLEPKLQLNLPSIKVDAVLTQELCVQPKQDEEEDILEANDDVIAEKLPLDPQLKIEDRCIQEWNTEVDKVLLGDVDRDVGLVKKVEPAPVQVETKPVRYQDCGKRPKASHGRGKVHRKARGVTALAVEFAKAMEDAKIQESVGIPIKEESGIKNVKCVRFDDNVHVIIFPDDTKRVGHTAVSKPIGGSVYDEEDIRLIEEISAASEPKPIGVAVYDEEDLRLMEEIEQEYGV